jgi:phospholipase/carboxylesterase
MSTLHANQPVYSAGEKLDDASTVMILLHGRGATAQDILSLSTVLAQPGLAFLAPQAVDFAWYPNRFIAPIEQNEPYLSSALSLIGEIIKNVETRGISSERIFIGGFSQGACLGCEYVIRNPRQYAGLLIFSGGYIGPLNVKRQPVGNLSGTPAFLGCSDVDPHIPLQRVQETTTLLKEMGAEVTEKIYPQMGHTIVDDELEFAKNITKKSL